MLLVVACATVFGASSAINASALGGASIQPSVFLLAFLVLRIATSPDFLSDKMEDALKTSAVMGVFALYGLVSALIYPKLFAHQIEVVPTRFIAKSAFAVEPLGPTSQNITQATYLVGTYAMLLATIFVAKVERRPRAVAMCLIGLAGVHSAFGVIDLASSAVGVDALGFLRNANYAIVDQQVGAFHRIQGTFSETSVYSSYGFVLLVFVTELWLRQIETKLTGPITLILACLLFFSTSSSAYVGLAIYAVILGFRMLYFPSTVGQRKALIMVGLAILAILLVLALAIAMPAFVGAFANILETMTTGKTKSFSGIQRGFWNDKAWEAFAFSKGLGIGVGSLRCSSLVAAIAGSMGVVGLGCFAVFAYRVLPFHRLSAYRLDLDDKTAAVGVAAGWAAIVGLGPAVVSAPSPDPGVMFAFMSGLAIAWAPYRQSQPALATSYRTQGHHGQP